MKAEWKNIYKIKIVTAILQYYNNLLDYGTTMIFAIEQLWQQ